MQREMEATAARQDQHLARERKERTKRVMRAYNKNYKRR
jgi:hypothetical protein